MKNEDFINKLHEDPSFVAILKAAKDDKERRFIKSFTESYMARVVETFAAVKSVMESNPEEFKKQLEEIQAGVVMDTQPPQSQPQQDKKKDDANNR
jgi:hypothetical protein